MTDKQFYVFHEGNNFSADQIASISVEVNKRRRILNKALENLQGIMQYTELPPKPSPRPISKTTNTKPRQIVTAKTVSTKPSNQKALKGRVSYKVKGPDGRPMNIAEIKNRINSIYDGKQGIIKQ